MLRRTPLWIDFNYVAKEDDRNLDCKSDRDSPYHHTRCVVGGIVMGPEGGGVIGSIAQGDGENKSKTIVRCNAVVVPDEALIRGGVQGGRKNVSRNDNIIGVVRRISILHGRRLILDHGDGINDDGTTISMERRDVLIVPPNTGDIRNENVVHGFIADASVGVAPTAFLDNENVEDVCTVLHLSTTFRGHPNHLHPNGEFRKDDEENQQQQYEKGAGVLERTLRSILTAQTGRSEEVFHVSFAYELFGQETDNRSMSIVDDNDGGRIDGLYAFRRRGAPSVTIDSAFDTACELFHSICARNENVDNVPSFLLRSEGMEQLVEQLRGGTGDNMKDDDNEGSILEGAATELLDNDQ